MARTSASLPLKNLETINQSVKDELERTNAALDNIYDAAERIQQQVGQLTGINLERNERVE